MYSFCLLISIFYRRKLFRGFCVKKKKILIVLCLGPDLLVGSVLDSLSCLMQCSGFDTPLGKIVQVEGIFPEGSDSIFPKTLSDENTN